MLLRILSIFLALNTLPSTAAFSQAENRLNIEQIAQFDTIPWGVDFLTPNTLIITLKTGRLALLDISKSRTRFISGTPAVDASGQGGFLDVAILPQSSPSPWIYFTYAQPTKNGATTALGRAKLSSERLIDWQTLFVADAESDSAKHFGSRIAFDQAGHVFFSVGERGNRNDAQDLTNHAGSIIRLNLDGSVPSDNPLINNKNARHEIWSYGHRNPQGLFYDQQTHTLWSNEHGPRGGDEINLIQAGANYGWPVVSHGKEYWGPIQVGEGTHKPGMQDPKKVFTPSIAPSDLIRYRGLLFKGWQGDFISTALALRHLNRTTINGSKIIETRYLTRFNERLRSITEAPDGALIISTDSGKILRVTPIK
jgi:glucose/arabinose dehydrogenase